jgi:tRNA (adenine22-N1)-methyltransferase
MNAQQLSMRLTRVASYVPKGAVVADIGSDHAYLPCYLVSQGVAERAVAGEVVKGPYESAKKQVIQEGLEDKIAVRLASGLEAIHADDGITAVTIAGMGGPLIVSILEQSPNKLNGVARLILQPNVHAQAIREWAQTHQWVIINEEIVKENNKIYEILVLERSSRPVAFTRAELLMGPLLMEQQTEVFREKWQRESAQWTNIIASIESTEQTLEIVEKKNELVQKIKLVEEVLNRENS